MMIAAILVLLAAVQVPSAATGVPTPVCAGGICLQPDDTSARQLARRYGPGAIENGGGTLCYLDRSLYVSFMLDVHDEKNPIVDGLRVGVEPDPSCKHWRRPSRHFPRLILPGGTVGIGSSVKDLERTYGRFPQFEVERYDGNKAVASWRMCAHCEILTVNVWFENDRLVEVQLADVAD